MREVWKRIESWLALADPGTGEALPGPAAPAHLDTVEARVGRGLPQDLRESLQLHDGTQVGMDLLGGWELLSASGIGEAWAALTSAPDRPQEGQPEGAVRAVWWHPAWIPFAGNAEGDYLCADLDPAPGGTPGQVVAYWSKRPERRLLASSYRAWLGGLVDAVAPAELLDAEGMPTPEGPDEVEARELLEIMAERGMVELRGNGAREDLVHQVADILGDARSPERRAEDLFHLLQKHPAVQDIRADDEALEALLEAW